MKVEHKLLELIHEYWLSVVPKNPANWNPINTTNMSFFGFYEWLRKRSAPQKPSKEQEQ